MPHQGYGPAIRIPTIATLFFGIVVGIEWFGTYHTTAPLHRVIAPLAALSLCLLLTDYLTPSNTRWLRKSPHINETLVISVALGIVTGTLSLVAFHHGLPVHQNVKIRSISDIMVAALGAVIVAPITEELFFRGWLFAEVEELISQRAAVVATSLVFTIPHHIAYTSGSNDVIGVGFALVAVMIIGLVLGALRWVTGSVLVPLALHIGLNGGFMLAILLLTSA